MSDDSPDASEAMSAITQSAQALYVAHLQATRAAQPYSPAQVAALHDAVRKAAQDLCDVCTVEAITPAEMMAAVYSE